MRHAAATTITDSRGGSRLLPRHFSFITLTCGTERPRDFLNRPRDSRNRPRDSRNRPRDSRKQPGGISKQPRNAGSSEILGAKRPNNVAHLVLALRLLGRHRIATVHPQISVCHVASRSNSKGASPRTRPHCLFRHSADIRTATISSSASCRPQKSRDLSLRRPPTRCLPTSCHEKSSCKWSPNRAGRRCYGHQ